MRLVPTGLEIGGKRVPLLAGAVHYWRLDPDDWRACLESTKSLGLGIIDVYVPWGVHEITPGNIELGLSDPKRDVAAFLKLCHELGLYVILRPGPHINAELTYFGIPERVVWDKDCQAQSPDGHPVMLPMVPVAFPVPSYASRSFQDEAARWLRVIGEAMTGLRYPDGPIVMVQIDNEGALYFRDGAYDQDYHPDAVALYREMLRDKYKTIEALQRVYGDVATKGAAEGDLRFATIEPPKRFDAKTPEDLARHLDWSEFHEHLLEHAFLRFKRVLEEAGLDGLPTSHNLPLGQEATPLNAAAITRAVDLVGLDYYHAAGPLARQHIARRTTELAVRCESLGVPAFACEMGAGFPPFFPPLEERDSAFGVLSALAYGLRGYNIYMAVERDRWIGAPIDPHGRLRPFATFWRKLSEALEQTRLFDLQSPAPVRLLTPRSERRLVRVMHAFGPLTGAIFSVLGAGARESALEDDLGLGYPPAIEADTLTRSFEAALEAQGVPFAHVGGEDRRVSLEGAKWIVVACSGALNPRLFERLVGAAESGAVITVGPREPRRDGSWRLLEQPFYLARLRPRASEIPLLLGDDPAAATTSVAKAVVSLGLPTFACDPDGIFATVHVDADQRARVLFLINPGDADTLARVTVTGATSARDVLGDETYEARRGAFEVRMQPRTVRMFAIASGG